MYNHVVSHSGTVDMAHLAHPLLIHLRSFFDLWESFTLQALQNGQPCISDHIMFEVGAPTVLLPFCSLPPPSEYCFSSFCTFTLLLQHLSSVLCADPPAAAVAGSFLGCLQHADS